MNNLRNNILTKKAVLFDLDGTLIDSMWMWKAIDVDYLKAHGYEYPTNLQREIEGMSFSETAVYFKDRFHLSDSLEKIESDWNNMAFDTYKNKVKLKRGIEEFLVFLKNNGIKTAIATSNSRMLTEIVLDSLKITDYFNAIVTSNEISKSKPAPEVYLKAAEKLNVSYNDCIVFEDIPNGIAAGKAAGMEVVTIDDDYSRELESVKCELADYYIIDYFDIINN